MTANEIKRKLRRGEYPVYKRRLKDGEYWYGAVRLLNGFWKKYGTQLSVAEFSKRDAMDHVKAVQEELDAGRDPFQETSPKTGHTLSVATQAYLQDCAERNLRPSTIRSYAATLHRFRKQVGDIPLAGIGKDCVRSFRSSFSGLSLHTVNIHQANLRAFLHWIKKEAPEHNWQIPEIRFARTDPKPFVDYYNEVECKRLLCAAGSVYFKNKQGRPIFPTHPLIAVLMMAGLRKNEAGNLHWEPPSNTRLVWPWVNLAQNQIAIPADNSKSRRIRYVPLLPALRIILENWPNERRGRLFPFSVESGALNRKWTEICEIAKVKRLKIHCLRDTFAVNLLINGMPLAIVAEILGHEDPSTTKKYYAVVGSLELQDAMGRVSKTFATPPPVNLLTN